MQIDISQYRFSELVDVPSFTRMLESFFLATGIPNGVVDVDGELLSMSAGLNACTQFHRVQPEAAERCRQSNLTIMHDLRAGCVAGGLCRNGLMDYATPVVIEGRQLATLFLGQVLHTPPDMAFFRQQAAELGWDESAYLASIAAIPVVDKERLQKLMAVMVEMAHMLATSGLARLRQNVLEHKLGEQSERRIQLEDILESSPVAIGWSDGGARIEYVNQQFTRLFGYTLADLPDLKAWYRQAYPDERYRETVVQPWVQALALARQTGVQPPELETDIICKNGDVRRIVVRPAWVARRQLVSFTDITERWQSEQRERAHDAMLEMVARGAALGNILNGIVQQIETEDTTARCSVLLLSEDGKHLLTGAAPSLPAFYNEAIHGIEIGVGVGSCGTAAYLGQRVIVEDIHLHDYWKPYLSLAQQAGLRACWSEPILSSRGVVLGTFAIYHAEPKAPQLQDLERIAFASNLAAIAIENRRTQEELERRAYLDYLTGLANRRYFFEQAEKELDRVRRYGGVLSVLMLDIDRFKLVNDTYGHKVGDLVLQKLAEVCLASLRDIDIIGRIGGEEFAILLPQTASEQALQAAERLRVAIAGAEIPQQSGLPLHFTASFGATVLVDKDASMDILLSQADQALYQAKAQGRNRVCLYRAQ
ncbi:MAG: PAS/PAC and GAF sensor-containing diguanylate cyclase [Comamonadaceae bacterium]|nr:MAG: PAS/PAC and GAF sensor-containing diguanylate cyclase [Comamonadaceae bacterium]